MAEKSGFRVSDNRNPPVLRLSDFAETPEKQGVPPRERILEIARSTARLELIFTCAVPRRT